MTRVFALTLVSLLAASCLEAWKAEPLKWACSDGGVCPGKYICDDGVCCDPVEGASACPTRPNVFSTLPPVCPDGGVPTRYYEDRDHDREGNGAVLSQLCAEPVQGGWVTTLGDCNDNDPEVNTRTPEVCNGKNDNCDVAGLIDEGLTPRTRFYRDEDGDGFGAGAGVEACVAPVGYVTKNGDCDAFSPARYPGADELCNGLDDDCDRVEDRDELSWVDVDVGTSANFPCQSSAFGVCKPGTFHCAPTVDGGVLRACTSSRAPDTFDRCDGLDNDCDNQVDEQPDCGGPDDFTATGWLRGARFQGTVTTTDQTVGCLKDVMTGAGSWVESSRHWAAAGIGYNLWYVEAPAGTSWDLSRPGLKLRLKLTIDASSAPTAFGNADSFRHPVIYLCGANAGELIRYVPGKPDAGGVALEDRPALFDQTLLLSFDQPKWFTGRGSGFDTSKVKRVEVLLHNNVMPWTVTVEGQSGFVP